MATWKKVIVSGSNAQLATITASTALQVGTNQYITTTQAGTYLTGSFTGSFTGNGSGLTNISFSNISGLPANLVSSSLFSSNGQGQITASINGVSSSFTDGLTTTDSPTFAGLTITTNALAVNNTNGITTNAATFPIAPSATTINIGTTSNTSINLGGGSSTVTIPGNLTVNGTTTIINTTNTAIKDQFILLASGSTGTMDGGIIVGNSATVNIGEALYWENNPGTTGRWAIASGVDATSTTVTPNSYVVTVSGSTTSPTGAPTYGGATNGIGNMYIDTSLTAATDNNIWIYA